MWEINVNLKTESVSHQYRVTIRQSAMIDVMTLTVRTKVTVTVISTELSVKTYMKTYIQFLHHQYVTMEEGNVLTDQMNTTVM